MNVDIATVQEQLTANISNFTVAKKTGKITLEVNISQGGIGQVYIETKEAITPKK